MGRELTLLLLVNMISDVSGRCRRGQVFFSVYMKVAARCTASVEIQLDFRETY